MAGYLVRLSTRALAQSFGSRSQVQRVIVSILVASALVLAVAVGVAFSVRGENADVRVLAGGLIGLALAVAALFAGDAATTVDPLDPRAVADAGMRPVAAGANAVIATLFGVPSLLALAALLVLAAVAGGHTAIGFAGAVLSWLSLVGMVRLGTAAGRSLAERRLHRDALAIIRYVLVLVCVPVVYTVIVLPWRQALVDSAAAFGHVLPAVPFAAGFTAAHVAQPVLALATAGATALVVVIIAVLIDVRTARRAMRRIDGGGAIRFGALGGPSATPALAVAWRVGISWLRDGRYQVTLITVIVLPIFLLIPLGIAGVPLNWLVLLPLPMFAFLLGWALHNDTAYDSTAFWLHVVGGLRSRDDRLGRALPTLIVGTVAVLSGGALTALFAVDWIPAFAVTGTSLALLGVAAGGSSLMSAIAPYPVAGPEDSPFAQPVRSWGSAVTLHPLAGLIELILCAPLGWLAWLAISEGSLRLALSALCIGIVVGALGAAAGIALGARALSRRNTSLLAFAASV